MSTKRKSQTVIPPVIPPIILSRPEAAKYLSCTVSWLRIEAAAEHITPIRLGRRVCFSTEELQRYKSQVCQDAGDMAGVR
jgi:excisionase family DNA binding protein